MSKFFKKGQVGAIVGGQWGDEAKGKMVEYAALEADVIYRGNGGDNAGHTVYVDGKKLVFHLLPVGLTHDRDRKINVVGSGVAFNPVAALKEIDMLEGHDMTFDGLRISHMAHLVLPQHILEDQLAEHKSGKALGTTGRGMGPTYKCNNSK